MADFDAAAHHFMVNMLQGGGHGGASAGPGSVGFFPDMPSFEGMQKKIQPQFKSIASLIEATQGFASQVTPQNLALLGPGLQIPAGFVPLSKKIAGFGISTKGG